jgi:RNA-directed DNA polymerase
MGHESACHGGVGTESMMTNKQPNQVILGASKRPSGDKTQGVSDDQAEKARETKSPMEATRTVNCGSGVTPVEGAVRLETSSPETKPPDQDWEKWLETKLGKISRVVRERPDEKIRSLICLIDEAHLRSSFRQLKAGKAPGMDGITKEDYSKVMDKRIPELVQEMKAFRYRPSAVRRVYIPKADGTKRPLGIPTLESKLIQLAMRRILDAVYEPMFVDTSYGFRPGRSAHDALRRIHRMIRQGRTHYIVEADIQSFFDQVDHKKLVELLEKKIADRGMIRYIVRFLKSGVMEDGRHLKTEEGTPQGGVISPLLANVFLHYVLDDWFYGEYRKNVKGQSELIRYADDFIAGFETKEEAEDYLRALTERLNAYGLKLHEAKTRIVPFSPRKFQGNSGVFEFLGFLHYVGYTRDKIACLKRRTSSKKMRMMIRRVGEWLKENRSRCKLPDIHKHLSSVLRGHFNYYGVNDNIRSMESYLYFVKRLFFKWINRRSQKKSMTWGQFGRYLQRYPLPRPRISVNLYVPVMA